MKRGQGETDETHDEEKDKIIEGEAMKSTEAPFKFKKKEDTK